MYSCICQTHVILDITYAHTYMHNTYIPMSTLDITNTHIYTSRKFHTHTHIGHYVCLCMLTLPMPILCITLCMVVGMGLISVCV
ncbi:hypothetical protein EON63_02315 [archaeon]|nr:MAG: hypothetical protein EON63_02315 [archaeon]